MNYYIAQKLTEFQHISSQLESLSLVIFAVIVAEAFIDLFANKKRDYEETIANFGIGIVNDIIRNSAAIFVALSGLFFVSKLSPFSIKMNWWTWILAVLLADFSYYWMHRAEHRVRILWAHHNVHHSSTDYDLTLALRQPWTGDFIIWITLIPMVLLGFYPLQSLIAYQLVGLYQVWVHNQKIGKLGVIDRILNTPSLHRVHHGSNPRYIDKNYGGIIIIWDRLFGTYEPETEKVIYGLTENINTRNLIQINLIEYLRIWSNLRNSQTPKEVLQSVFGTPEWKPKALESKEG